MTKPHITIVYCTQCNWLLRASWMASELLSTFGSELGAVTLVPGTGGVFTIDAGAPGAGGERVWDRKADGGFPDAAALKQRVRDIAFPDWNLGHADRRD